MTRLIKWLAAVTTLGMFVVLVAGATVTNTGSQQGCGRSWPLCQGKFVPQFAVSTLIEWIHRVDAGVETVLVLALAGSAWYLYRDRLEVRILAPTMVAFLFVQAGLGAWAVMYPQMAAVLALHFGVSLIAFASVLLLSVYIFEMDRDAVRNRALPLGFRRLAWAVTAYSYVVVYLGAYVRHSEADEACAGWPLCNGAVLPSFVGKVLTTFSHRVAALLLALAIVSLVAWSWRLRDRRPDIFRASLFALVAVVFQAASGAIVVFTRLDLFSALSHAALAGLLFGSLTYLCMHVLPASATRAAQASPPVRSPDASPVQAT